MGKISKGALDFLQGLVNSGKVSENITRYANPDDRIIMMEPSTFRDLAEPLPERFIYSKDTSQDMVESLDRGDPLKDMPFLTVEDYYSRGLLSHSEEYREKVRSYIDALREIEFGKRFDRDISKYEDRIKDKDFSELWDDYRTSQMYSREGVPEDVIVGHEGRNRSHKWEELYPGELMPVRIQDRRRNKENSALFEKAFIPQESYAFDLEAALRDPLKGRDPINIKKRNVILSAPATGALSALSSGEE